MPTPPTQIPTSVSTFPPSGLDRATGLDGFPGVPTIPGAIIIVGTDNNGNPFIVDQPTGATFFGEYPDSPVFERAEQGTISHRFYCDEDTGIVLVGSYPRGSILLDSAGNLTRVLSSTLQWTKGGYCNFTVTAEGMNFDPPPDLFSIEVVELNPAAEKHPRYTELTYIDRYNIRNANISDASDLEQQYELTIGTFPGAPVPPATVPADLFARTRYNEGKELLLKLHKGEESFYLPGFRITWSQFFWASQFIDCGGYIEDPITQGGLPFFFWSIDGTETVEANNWFSDMVNINPSIYKNGISWLRQADSVDYERTWFKITHTWIGGPLGQWDNEWYKILNTSNGAGQTRVVQPYQTAEDASAVIL